MARPYREGGCRLVRGELAGWEALTLANGVLRVTLLPGKGAEIVELAHVATGIDVLFRAPWGLRPPGSPPREGSDGHEFLGNYAGGWQELFPSAGDSCVYRGEPIPFHGEVATLSWDAAVAREDAQEVAVRCAVSCRQTPFRLERLLRLARGSSELLVEETVTNVSGEPAHFVWGHHCVLGPPFVERGARLRLPARTLVTLPELWEETARLEPGQRSPWPHARLRRGGTVDLGEIPGPEAASHDDVYATDLDGGWAVVENPRLRLAFRLEWDPAVFRWVVAWQPYGGAEAMPLRGAYALGVEPWTTRLDLEQAAAAGEALELAGGGSLSTTLRATISVR